MHEPLTYYPWLSILPPLVAIVLAMITRRVVLSLALGVLTGAILLDPNWSALASQQPALESQQPALESQQPDGAHLANLPGSVASSFFEDHLWTSLSEPDHLRVFCFTLLMGAMIGVIHRSGGMHAVVSSLAPLARSRRGGQLMTWALGLIVFIDDYANSLLLGNTMRPLTDRLGISREKLAFVVDCTAAPVSGLALVSTWVAGEIGYIEAGFENLGLTESPSGFAIFIETIPYRFYVLWALLFVPLVALSGRDFGPMLAAERHRRDSGTSPGAAVMEAADDPAALGEIPHRWYNAVAPIAVALLVTLALLWITGRQALGPTPEAAGPWRLLIEVIGNSNSYVSLVYGSLAGLATAAALVLAQRLMTGPQLRKAAFDGARLVLPSLTILWLAWALSGTTDSEHLGTGQYLGGLIRDPSPPGWVPSWLADSIRQVFAPRWMPTIVFLLASVVAFSTGTSWGTMGILMPIVVSTTYQMLTAEPDPAIMNPAGHPLLIATIGSVLAGAIFGDHCSPISDTTVLSAQASGCDHLAHVHTQLPYALFVAFVSVLCGTLPIGLGVSVWPLLPLGVVVMAGGVWLLGRRV